MHQLDLSPARRPALTMDGVVDDLALHLRHQHALAARRRAAYVRLARHILDDDVPAAALSWARERDADPLVAA
jgi:hypothetical protein